MVLPKANKLCIGTAQFGMDYGVFNINGQPDIKEISQILIEGYRKGIRYLDTAPSYGNSEMVLGQCMKSEQPFKVITKTPHFNQGKIVEKDANYLKKTFFHSLKQLKKESTYGLLLHNAEDLFVKGGNLLVNAMNELKKERLTRKIGVSVYTSQQIEEIILNFDIDLIQAPINVLDQRLVSRGCLKKLKDKQIEIHARSVFLQGVIIKNVETLPPYFDKIKGHLRKYHQFLDSVGITPIQAALGYLNSLKEVDVVLVGIDSRQQLKENIKVMNETQINYDMRRFALHDQQILDPSKWIIQ